MAKSTPESYRNFLDRYPKLGEAWENAREAEETGPLDAKNRRLIKLAIAVGAMREGAVRSAVRKALAEGVEPAAIRQVVALCATTIGFPSAVAIDTWISPLLDTHKV